MTAMPCTRTDPHPAHEWTSLQRFRYQCEPLPEPPADQILIITGGVSQERLLPRIRRQPIGGSLGRCSGCNEDIALKVNGKIRVHGPFTDRCPGSDQPPERLYAASQAAIERLKANLVAVGVDLATPAVVPGGGDTA